MGLNPGPLGHESSALPLDHGYSSNIFYVDKCFLCILTVVNVQVLAIFSWLYLENEKMTESQKQEKN
jgi:hypothetical protein